MEREPPHGFLYHGDVLSAAEEADLASRLAALEFVAVTMRGQVARRRTAHFGWIYGYESWRITPGPALPGFLEPLRERAASLAGVAPASLAEALLTEYPPGAGIGWHRDAPVFGIVIAVSLFSPCRLRLALLPLRIGAATTAFTPIRLLPSSCVFLGTCQKVRFS